MAKGVYETQYQPTIGRQAENQNIIQHFFYEGYVGLVSNLKMKRSKYTTSKHSFTSNLSNSKVPGFVIPSISSVFLDD